MPLCCTKNSSDTPNSKSSSSLWKYVWQQISLLVEGDWLLLHNELKKMLIGKVKLEWLWPAEDAKKEKLLQSPENLAKWRCLHDELKKSLIGKVLLNWDWRVTHVSKREFPLRSPPTLEQYLDLASKLRSILELRDGLILTRRQKLLSFSSKKEETECILHFDVLQTKEVDRWSQVAYGKNKCNDLCFPVYNPNLKFDPMCPILKGKKCAKTDGPCSLKEMKQGEWGIEHKKLEPKDANDGLFSLICTKFIDGLHENNTDINSVDSISIDPKILRDEIHTLNKEAGIFYTDAEDTYWEILPNDPLTEKEILYYNSWQLREEMHSLNQENGLFYKEEHAADSDWGIIPRVDPLADQRDQMAKNKNKVVLWMTLSNDERSNCDNGCDWKKEKAKRKRFKVKLESWRIAAAADGDRDEEKDSPITCNIGWQLQWQLQLCKDTHSLNQEQGLFYTKVDAMNSNWSSVKTQAEEKNCVQPPGPVANKISQIAETKDRAKKNDEVQEIVTECNLAKYITDSTNKMLIYAYLATHKQGNKEWGIEHKELEAYDANEQIFVLTCTSFIEGVHEINTEINSVSAISVNPKMLRENIYAHTNKCSLESDRFYTDSDASNAKWNYNSKTDIIASDTATKKQMEFWNLRKQRGPLTARCINTKRQQLLKYFRSRTKKNDLIGPEKCFFESILKVEQSSEKYNRRQESELNVGWYASLHYRSEQPANRPFDFSLDSKMNWGVNFCDDRTDLISEDIVLPEQERVYELREKNGGLDFRAIFKKRTKLQNYFARYCRCEKYPSVASFGVHNEIFFSECVKVSHPKNRQHFLAQCLKITQNNIEARKMECQNINLERNSAIFQKRKTLLQKLNNHFKHYDIKDILTMQSPFFKEITVHGSDETRKSSATSKELAKENVLVQETIIQDEILSHISSSSFLVIEPEIPTKIISCFRALSENRPVVLSIKSRDTLVYIDGKSRVGIEGVLRIPSPTSVTHVQLLDEHNNNINIIADADTLTICSSERKTTTAVEKGLVGEGEKSAGDVGVTVEEAPATIRADEVPSAPEVPPSMVVVPSNNINNIPTVSGDWQDTAKLIGSIIQKPTMKEKHLKRPPFRFVFDIVINIMNKTGFLSGLFSGHELESKLMSTDVSLKLNWYKKLVTAVGFFWNIKLKVEPENMIAGKKCKNTLRLLQVIALGAQSGRDCKHAVLQTLELDKDRVETVRN